MSSSSKSSQQSLNTLPFSSNGQQTTRFVIVSKVSLGYDEKTLLHSLGHTYVGVERVSRLYDQDENPTDEIRVDFKTDKETMKILQAQYIFIDGKKYPAHKYQPLVCHRCQKEGHYASQCPRKPLTEERFHELLEMQKKQLQNMMDSFEAKWNARLSELNGSSTGTNLQSIVPICKDLTTFCQQFNQQNIQMQRQLGSIVNRVQNMQTNSNIQPVQSK
ncbi:unnamed protein product [Rotaria socialis]|uniref:CCHC-type domain-containing protein n=1 Tax=Rotaria socialis TaxID=392032 RepID=A0A818BEI3_9BILA|nr:unnamed protein product [Rotaria socialis]CAF3345877.1 unnamed protein product [Rotaria socialis]CAF3419012.1 unnamed protein product [Rotaria socialis]CAF3702761.1 unnamed protein product [Rotaria socialis]CAF4162265.1 unnamed protein product [Rotaria socialis]